ncbi:endo-beta-D-1,4-glucanase [Helicostylum pulchrum]|nr:endo-beta-D-1,4-glucanase [Helicostylum pulchrum]
MKTTFTIASIALAISLGTAVDASCSAKYYQCGGINWTGPTCCEAGSTCVSEPWNAYYSQCPVTTTTTKKPVTTTTQKPVTTTTKKPVVTTTVQKPVITTTTIAKPAPTNGGSSDYAPLNGGKSGSGSTTRYWDCCKASCSWPGKASVSGPVDTCGKNGISILDDNAQSGCNGGDGYMCNNNQPWAVNDGLAYGFAAASIAGSSESGWCCGCYELTFTSGPVNGKKMVVQVTNTGGDLGQNHFDLQMPGGGVGIFDGCSSQWNIPSEKWGARYGGISSASECDGLPSQLQAGCKWRFNWFKNADNPSMSFKEVSCPAALVTRSGCKRN